MSDTPTLAEQFEAANQSIIKHGLREARKDGRALGPEMFIPEHATLVPIGGVGGRIFVAECKHEGLSNKSIMDIPPETYGG